MTVKRSKWLSSKSIEKKVILVFSEMNYDTDCAVLFCFVFNFHILN